MRNTHWWALGALAAATLGTILFVTPAQSQRPTGKQTVAQAIVKRTKLEEKDVAKMLDALGPVIRDKLANGETIDFPGVGQFRVVHIPDHRDLVNGRPAVIAGSNTVEFGPAAEMVDASNSPDAVPAVTVPQFEYNTLPGQTPGMKSSGTRAPNVRAP